MHQVTNYAAQKIKIYGAGINKMKKWDKFLEMQR